MNSFSSIQTPPQAHSPSRTTSSSLQSNTGSSSTSLLGSISNLSSNSVSQPSHQAFLEVCINTGKYTKTLSEIDLSSVGCDGELFKRIKKEYSRLFRSWLLKPSGVHFVKVSCSSESAHRILRLTYSLVLNPRSSTRRHPPKAPINSPQTGSRRKTLPLHPLSASRRSTNARRYLPSLSYLHFLRPSTRMVTSVAEEAGYQHPTLHWSDQ